MQEHIKPVSWFRERIGTDVLREGKRFTISNEKEAQYHYSLQGHFKYTDVPTIHTSSEPQYCEACQG